MSVDKLVDSTLLDAACTYEAGKIREKLGSSAQITYDLANGKGFGDAIAAIPTGGGGNYEIVGGTVTLAEEANSISIETNFDPEYAWLSISPYDTDVSLLPTSWKTGSAMVDRVHKFSTAIIIRNLNGSANLGNANNNNQRLGSYSNGYYSFDRANNSASFLSGVQYYWFAWRAKT